VAKQAAVKVLASGIVAAAFYGSGKGEVNFVSESRPLLLLQLLRFRRTFEQKANDQSRT
jgi:hypothetical protein